MVTDEPPLLTLLSWVWIALTIEIDNAFEAVAAPHVGGRFRISLPMWANGLRLVDDDGVTADELRAKARAGVNLGGLERWGYLQLGDDEARRQGFGTSRGLRGTTMLRPIRAGQNARRAWPRVVAVVEEAHRQRFGSGPVDALARALATAGASESSLPWAPPEIVPSDGFRTAVVGTADPADDEPLPLVAQLGRVLTSYTLEYEEVSRLSLPLAANFLRVIGTGDVPLRDLSRLAGVSKEAVAMATGWLQRRGYASAQPQRCISLTAAGLSELDRYRSVAAGLGDSHLRAALNAIVSRREMLAAGLEPQDGCWRGTKPYLTQTNARLADPTALPWQPMVLHRGGWPDGA
jgi:hypothetical protein